MDASWPIIAGPAVAVVGGAVLHRRPRRAYWTICWVLTLILAAVFYSLNRDPGPPFNAPSALAAVSVAVPMLGTFGIERFWWMLGASRPVATAILSVPLGIIVYLATGFVAFVMAVNLGILWP